MVQVHYEVIEKTHKLLSDQGVVIITQPNPTPSLIQIEADNVVLFSENLIEPVFHKILINVKQVIQESVATGLFYVRQQETDPARTKQLYINEYSSLDEWRREHFSYSFDNAFLDGFNSKLEDVPRLGKYTIKRFYQEDIIILGKIG